MFLLGQGNALSSYYDRETKFYRFDETADYTVSSFFDETATELGLGTNDVMRLYSSEKDKISQQHDKFVQYYKGLPVENTLFFLHSSDERVELAHGDIVPNLSLSTVPAIMEDAALANALSYLNADEYYWENTELENALKRFGKDSTEIDSSATYYPKGSLIISTNDNSNYSLSAVLIMRKISKN